MTNRLAALVLVLGLGLGSPALAQGSGEDSPSELAKQGLERLLRAMEIFIEMIPEYEAPELNENGDIIIRRKHPDRPAPKPAPPDVDETKT